MPKEQLHPRIWNGADRKFKKIDWSGKEREHHNKVNMVIDFDEICWHGY